ncbi:ZZ-type zinc finger-containing protein 3-like isoform X2 [Dendronephthya gigantea]|uniref:ZZ-type zinc finger-containing protein 3-like isoform X2 n=1 Tax=Dendronephthya gigantea TaxID=151771 RepID=UPI00106D5F6F|nr:ZZ-type zinc finger-containing protein 3-like isoform X2 [Dendronephthya gigantea]
MGEKNSEEYKKLDYTEDDCDLDEIDIINDPSEQIISKNYREGPFILDGTHHTDDMKNDLKLDKTKNFPCDNREAGTSNSTADSGENEIMKNSVKDETNSREFSNSNSLHKVQFNCKDEGVPDEKDVYSRFYFESDHLALKDNADYRLLLQTLVALEAQRKQAIEDYEKLIKLRKEALAEPVKFVEKLQNNEALGIPLRQSVIKVPQINWEAYSGAIDDFSQFGLLHQHNTRHSVGAGTTVNLERANQRWEEQSTTSNGSFGEISQESLRFSLGVDSSRYVRGKLATSDKPLTFNQPWTVEEQRKLERLLQVFPQELVEAKRWSKIAHALGNRTPKQVASRVQKYFIKLARSGLPIPGREPNLTRVLPKQLPRARSSQQQAVSFRNSTFFPSYKPRVYMEDNEKSDVNSLEWSDDLEDISDDETIPKELRNTKEYWEILHLKRLKRKRAEQDMCDLCGMSPILGVRWHCVECPSERSTDFCSDCVNIQKDGVIHLSSHKMEPVDWTENDFVDGDYAKLGETSKGYNYLDPNFLPAAT